MIIDILIKDPDGVHDSLLGTEVELREQILEKFFKFGEYCQVQIDTDTMTAKVIEVVK